MTASQSAERLGREIVARLGELSRISDSAEGITRLYLSPAHRRAADLVATWMRGAGMTDPDPALRQRVFQAMMTMGRIDIATIEAVRSGD